MTIPTDAQFFSKTDKTKPDIAFLKNHFYREGRLKEEHALYIIDRATQLLRAEPNVLSVEAPVTGVCATTTKSIRHLTPLFHRSLRGHSRPIRACARHHLPHLQQLTSDAIIRSTTS